MLDALNLPCEEGMVELNSNVKSSIEEFIGDTPQFDDITMLSLKYNGTENS